LPVRKRELELLDCPSEQPTLSMNWLDALQWPAMVVTVIAAWLIGSERKSRRMIGFWCFLLSNVLWIVWGWHDRAWAMVTLQVILAGMNIRGATKNETDSPAEK
jgi:hypothetical protein